MALSNPSAFILLLLSNIILVQAVPIPVPMEIHIPSWLQPMIPRKGTTIQEEIKCYSLPYGGIGFLSHFLTYWAIFWLGFGRRPYWPTKRLSAGRTDIALSLIQVIVSVLIAGFTISRCRNRWQFMLIAIWKVIMSVEVGIWGLRASWLVMKRRRGGYKYTGEQDRIIWRFDDWTPYTLIFYSLGMIVGMVGLLALVWRARHDKQILQISAAFFSVTAAIIIVCSTMLCCCCGFGSKERAIKLLMAMVFSVILVCALYCDWILGDFAGSLVGVPSGDASALYWIYFAVKRLPLLMT